jgi:hypothetical protein
VKKPAANKGGRPPKGAPKLRAELVAAELVALRGNVAAIARKFGVARSSVIEFVQARELLVSIQADVREGRLDDAESALDRAVLNGEGWAVCFLLKTLGKKRGYVERQELEHSGSVVEVHVYIPPKDDATEPA